MRTNYLKTKDGARLFLALAEADPKAALECLKRTIGKWPEEELLEFVEGRRHVVWALEKMAVWRDLFADAARLLLTLGEAENERWSNNASGVFAELFSLGYGRIAPTEASPQERFPVLREALESISKERRMLGLRACDQALESQHFARSIGAEYQGLRKEPRLWTPATYGELFDAYRQVWQMLYERMDRLPDDEQEQTVNILLKRARGLAIFEDLTDLVITTISQLIKKPYVDKKKVVAIVIQILHYDGKELRKEIRQRWEQLKDDLVGHDFSSFMRRYIGMDLLEDKFDEEGHQVNQTQSKVVELVQQAIENKDLLLPEFGWLVTTEAQNGYRFGYELGKRDKDFSFLPILLNAQRKAKENPSVSFLGGYLRALFEKDQDEWEKRMDALAADRDLNCWMAEITWRSGISNRAAIRIIGLAEQGIIAIRDLRIFGWGSVIGDLAEDIYAKWISFLLTSSDRAAISIALDLYHFYYLRKSSKGTLPEDLTFRLLTHQLLFQKAETGERWQMDEHDWAEIGSAFVKCYPEKGFRIAEKVLEHYGEAGTIFENYYGQPQHVLDKITELYPRKIWILIKKYLSSPTDSRTIHIEDWLHRALFYIPPELIWEWVDEDVESRAWYLATFVPKVLCREKDSTSLARELLVRYGSRKDVREALMANFSTETWSGPASLHYQSKKQWLLDFKKDEDNENVKRWIDEYVSSLDREIEHSRIEEERSDF